MAENILSWQADNGGWPLMNTTREASTGNPSQAGPWGAKGALISATYNEMRFLARGYRATEDERYREAVLRGLDFILNAQIKADGERTAWAQQYDPENLESRPARPFEPVAISAGESAAVVSVLMSIDDPSAAVTNAIEAAVQWYRDVQIDGYELVDTEDDLSLRRNADAPPLWARFYEIGTNRPIFAGRDGVVKYELAEIEQERRSGYDWYHCKGAAVLEAYEEWKYAQQWNDQPPTNTDEARVGEYTFLDPLVMSSGDSVETVSQWEERRRPEILRLFAEHQHGRTPSKDVQVSHEIVERDGEGLDGAARRIQARVRFPDYPDGPVIRVLPYVPADAEGPVPTLLHLGFSPNVLVMDEPGIDEGMAWSSTLEARVPDRDATLVGSFDAKHFVANGFGVAMVYYGDIDPDFDHGGEHGVRSMFGGGESPRAENEWGSIGA